MTMESVDRLGRLRALLREQQLPLALVGDPFNVCYLTGYWTILSGIPGTEQLLAVPVEGRPWLAVPGLEETLAREQCPDLTDIRYLRPGETLVHGGRRPAQTVSQLVRSAIDALPHGASIGADVSPLRTDRYRALEESLGGRPVIDIAPHLAAMRASKDPHEVRLIREAALITAKAAAAIFHALRPGVTENELAAEAVRVIWSNGGTISHLVVASGPRGALPHALPTARAVAQGEFVVVDIGVFWSNYWAEIARTFVAGTRTPEQARQLELVQDAQTAARNALRPGIPARGVDEAARAVLRAAGYDDGVYIHSTGHGLGVMGPDAPAITPHNAAPVPAGATLTIEPGLYFPGIGGIRIEDSFYVSDNRVECLTEEYHALVR
jgi:Xaa-Pro aminopeptidase